MPKRYEAIKQRFLDKGLSEAEAKTHAAKIFNATRRDGEAAVTGKKAGDETGGANPPKTKHKD